MNTRTVSKIVLSLIFLAILGWIGHNDYNDKMEELGHREMQVK